MDHIHKAMTASHMVMTDVVKTVVTTIITTISINNNDRDRSSIILIKLIANSIIIMTQKVITRGSQAIKASNPPRLTTITSKTTTMTAHKIATGISSSTASSHGSPIMTLWWRVVAEGDLGAGTSTTTTTQLIILGASNMQIPCRLPAREIVETCHSISSLPPTGIIHNISRTTLVNIPSRSNSTQMITFRTSSSSSMASIIPLAHTKAVGHIRRI